ncbi:glycosyltransferase family 4 protein [Desulfobacterales bacterium HSG17]|nr:glycosyltransferase family 4 protein [Desulfobacterales bacterium HSG17]
MKVLYISSERSEESILLKTADNIEFREVQIHLRKDMGFPIIKKVYDTYKIAKLFCPDLILAEQLGMGTFFTVFIKKKYNILLVTRMKGNLWKEYQEIQFKISFKEKIAKLLNYLSALWILKNTDAVLPISNSVKNCIDAKMKNPPQSYIAHIPHSKNLTGNRKIQRKNPNRNILTVTNFNFWGKVEPLVNSIPMIYPLLEKFDIEWIILGEGTFLEKCKNISKPYRKYVRFLGYQPTKPYYNGSAVCMLYISGLDGLPNVLLESFYYKLPVIINQNCPAVEFISDGYNGIIVNSDDSESICSTLEKLFNNDSYRKFLSDNAYQYLYDNFSLSVVSSELENALKKCIHGKCKK